MKASPAIRILCVDDHPIVLEGLSGVLSLQPDFLVVGTATTGTEAVALFRTLEPAIVLLDLRLRDTTGFEVMEQIFKIEPNARIVILTSLEGDADIERALATGARGYVVKGATREELTRAIRTVHAGRRYIPGDVAATMAEYLSSEKLTPREHSVLALIAQGRRNKEIGAELAIAEDTVKMHVKNILAKLGVNDRTEAVTVALRRGIHHL